MADNLYYDILDEKRRRLLPLIEVYKKRFYLAGGTGLALQLGHRDSIDFDFFSPNTFSTADLWIELNKIFPQSKLIKSQEEKDTLTITVDDIKFSFFVYPYKIIRPLINSQYLNIASLEDIGAMKLAAIVSRPMYKDYVDLYFIMHKVALKDLLEIARTKYPSLDTNLILKSLVYFQDIKEEPLRYKHSHNATLGDVKIFLRKQVKHVLP